MHAPLHSLPLLAVLAPAAGALVVARLDGPRARRRVAVATTAAALALSSALWALAGETPIRFSVSWMPSLGASFALGTDGASPIGAVLALWISILSLVAILSADPSRAEDALDPPRTSDDVPVLLGMEAALIGVFLARDLLLLFSFAGACIVCLSWLLSETRARTASFVGLQVVVFAGFLGLFAAGYAVVRAQTGFPSTDPERWQSMVLFPDTQGSVFAFALLLAVALLPAFPFALSLGRRTERAPLPTRLLLLGGWSLVGGYVLITVIVPVLPAGATTLAPLATTLGAISVLVAAASRASSFDALVGGYQGVFLVTLFSFPTRGDLDARLWMLHAATALVGLAIASHDDAPDAASGVESRRRGRDGWERLSRGLLLWTAAAAPGSIGFLALRSTVSAAWESSAPASLLALSAFALLGWTVLRRRRRLVARRRTWLLLAIVATSLAVGIYPEPWRSRLGDDASATPGEIGAE